MIIKKDDLNDDSFYLKLNKEIDNFAKKSLLVSNRVWLSKAAISDIPPFFNVCSLIGTVDRSTTDEVQMGKVYTLIANRSAVNSTDMIEIDYDGCIAIKGEKTVKDIYLAYVIASNIDYRPKVTLSLPFSSDILSVLDISINEGETFDCIFVDELKGSLIEYLKRLNERGQLLVNKKEEETQLDPPEIEALVVKKARLNFIDGGTIDSMKRGFFLNFMERFEK